MMLMCDLGSAGIMRMMTFDLGKFFYNMLIGMQRLKQY